jgi:hypothetical protein
MRNDARPVGQNAHDESPVDERQKPEADEPLRDPRESVTHDRQSHVVNKDAADNARRTDADVDPVMPTGDSTLPTKI